MFAQAASFALILLLQLRTKKSLGYDLCSFTSRSSCIWQIQKSHVFVSQTGFALQDPDLGTLQTPELAGIPKPRQYRDINTVTSELQVAGRSPRESQELVFAVGGQAQESTSADEEEEGATGLLTLRNSDWQQQQPQQQSDQAEQGHHSQQAEQQVVALDNHDADRLNQQKQLFQAQLDAQDVLLKESQQDAADKGEPLAQETAVLQALRLETESHLDLAIQQQEHIFALEQEAIEQQRQAAQLQKQQQEEHQQQQIAAALKFKEKLSEMEAPSEHCQKQKEPEKSANSFGQ